MSHFIRIIAIIFLVYLIAGLLLGSNSFYYNSMPVLSKFILLGVFVYLLFVVIKSFRKNAAPASGKTWFYRVVGALAFLYFFKEFFGMISYKFFSSADDLLEVSESVPPAMMWALIGLLIGLIYGSFVAWRKYRLDFKITLIPIGLFLIAIFVLSMADGPVSSAPAEKIVPSNDYSMESDISGSTKKFIVNRWVVTDISGKSREGFLRKNNDKSELEFKKNGKCYLNENGTRKMILYYTISFNGRALFFNNPNNSAESRQMKIISISKNELVITSELFQNDTAFLRAR